MRRGPGQWCGCSHSSHLSPSCHALPTQVVICGDPQEEDTKEMLRCVHSIFSPNKVEMPALPALPWSPASCCHPLCCRPHCWCLHPFPSTALASILLLLLLSCIPSGKHPVLSIFVSAAGRAMAGRLHLSPWHRAAQPRERLQQTLLSLPAVYTVLSRSPASPVLLSQGKTFHCGADMSCPLQMQPDHLLPGATVASLAKRQGSTSLWLWVPLARRGCFFPKALSPAVLSLCTGVTSSLCISVCLLGDVSLGASHGGVMQPRGAGGEGQNLLSQGKQGWGGVRGLSVSASALPPSESWCRGLAC